MKTKTELSLYSFYNISGMKLHLEHMAQRGWFLDKITQFGWHYRKGEPKKLTYAVSYYAKASAFEPEVSEGQQTFQDFCEHAGWHLAAGNAKLQVFYNEQEDPVPIYTDPESELEAIEAVAKSTIPAFWMFTVLSLFELGMLISGYFDNPINFLSDSFRLSGVCSIVLLSACFINDLCRYYIWRKKARTAAQSGETVPTAKSSLLLSPVLIFAALIVMLLGLMGGRQPEQLRYFILNLLYIIGLIFIVNSVRLLLKKKKVDKNVNIALTLTVDIILAAVFSGLLTFDVFHIVRHDEPQEQDKMLLTVSAVNGEENVDFKGDMILSNSVFMSQNRGWEYPVDGESLSYWVVDVKAGFLKDFCLKNMLHEKDELGSYGDDYDPDCPDYIYNEIPAQSWNADRAWQLSAYGDKKNDYLLQYGDRFAQLALSFEPTEAEKLRVSELLNNK